MRKALMILAMIALLAGGVAAEEEETTVKTEKVEKLDGKKLYREMCKVCHGPDAEAGEYAPMYLIQEQWTQSSKRTTSSSTKA